MSAGLLPLQHLFQLTDGPLLQPGDVALADAKGFAAVADGGAEVGGRANEHRASCRRSATRYPVADRRQVRFVVIRRQLILSSFGDISSLRTDARGAKGAPLDHCNAALLQGL